MAVQWCYKLDGEEYGPVSFKELVKLVRDGEVAVDDPVKADWQNQWQLAAEVVGLFHMAGRQDVLEKWEAEERELAQLREIEEAAQRDKERSQTEIPHPASEPDQDGWDLSELLPDVAEHHSDVFGPVSRDQTNIIRETSEISRNESLFTSAMRDADAAIENRSQIPRKRWFLFNWSTKRPVLRSSGQRARLPLLVQFGIPVLFANLAMAGILYWSRQEQQRFPRPEGSPVSMNFPLRGECSEFEYQCWLAGTMLLIGGLSIPVSRVFAASIDHANR